MEPDEAQNFADEHNMIYREVSAKTGQNVQEVFYEMADKANELVMKFVGHSDSVVSMDFGGGGVNNSNLKASMVSSRRDSHKLRRTSRTKSHDDRLATGFDESKKKKSCC